MRFEINVRWDSQDWAQWLNQPGVVVQANMTEESCGKDWQQMQVSALNEDFVWDV